VTSAKFNSKLPSPVLLGFSSYTSRLFVLRST